ncbi:unnamed protein product [Parnassius apollo]|uniref:(apollo) hypothetical protein n=1 Tax=Parnassius apollo TaxID=110799 RepID=A0A8S3VYF6_PARAO|nr:unnamed protein product [Parnassius apollo]
MEDFLDKIKKKLSVDNILDLMKDGKLKEEIKQTLTAKMNLNENPRFGEGKSSEDSSNLDSNDKITIETVQPNVTPEQSKAVVGEQSNDKTESNKNNFNVLQKPNIQSRIENTESIKKSEEISFYD